jgi:hypothetical protein
MTEQKVTLKEGTSSVCVAGGTPCSVTGAAGASDIFIESKAEMGIRRLVGDGRTMTMNLLSVVVKVKGRKKKPKRSAAAHLSCQSNGSRRLAIGLAPANN